MPGFGQAIAYYGPDSPSVMKQYPVPKPEPGAILIKVRLATICGSDLHVLRGEIDYRTSGLPLPIIVGHEMMGEVAALGREVSTDSCGDPLSVGDRVVYSFFCPCGTCVYCRSDRASLCPNMRADRRQSSDDYPHFHGAFAQYFYLRPRHVIMKVPDYLTDEIVAPINCALCTMISALQKVSTLEDKMVVVQGCGALGLYGAALAKDKGASRVIGIEGIPSRISMSQAFGVDFVVDLKQYGTLQERVALVMDLTNGTGADVVVDTCGASNILSEGLSMLAAGGSYLEVGNIGGGRMAQFDPSSIVYGHKRIIGCNLWEPDVLSQALRFLEKGRTVYPLDKVVGAIFNLEELDRVVLSGTELNDHLRIGLRPWS